MRIISQLYRLGPLWFGLAFLAPLIDQTMRTRGTAAPFELPTLVIGLLVGSALGTIATLRRNWLW
jgi:hypothetical protein